MEVPGVGIRAQYGLSCYHIFFSLSTPFWKRFKRNSSNFVRRLKRKWLTNRLPRIIMIWHLRECWNGRQARLRCVWLRRVGSSPISRTRKTRFALQSGFFSEIHPVGWLKSPSGDEIPFGGEIRLDGGWVDFICAADFILAPARISLPPPHPRLQQDLLNRRTPAVLFFSVHRLQSGADHAIIAP